jgi:hypothetical protein
MIIPKGAQLIRIGPLSGFIPRSWNELPTSRLLSVYATLLTAGYEPGITRTELLLYQRVCILSNLLETDVDTLLGVLGQDAQPGRQITDDLASQLVHVLDQIAFCFERVEEEEDQDEADEGSHHYRLRLDLTRCPYRRLEDGEVTLYAPADGLRNLTIFELGHLFTALDAYARDRQARDLHRALAIVYRPGKPASAAGPGRDYGGDRRQPLYGAEHLIDARARRWRRVPHLVQQVLWFWLVSCQQQIVHHPALSVLFAPDTSGGDRSDPFGWAGTLLHLAGENLAHLPGVATQSYQIALLQLAREKQQALELEARRREVRTG